MYGETSNTLSIAFFMLFMIATLVAFVLYLIPSIIINWRLYKKAGFNGWEVIVPVYSLYVLGLISKKEMWMVWTAVALTVISYIPAFSLLGFAGLIFTILLLIGFIKQYNGSTGFWVSYFLLPIVGLFLVDKVEYIGEGVEGAPNVVTIRPKVVRKKAVTKKPKTATKAKTTKSKTTKK